MLAIGLLEETTVGADITWLLWVALGFFALMVVVGWLVSRKQKPEEPEPVKHESKEEHH
jgi:cytochrome c-type biogenesis protein CcmH/NrfF